MQAVSTGDVNQVTRAEGAEAIVVDSIASDVVARFPIGRQIVTRRNVVAAIDQTLHEHERRSRATHAEVDLQGVDVVPLVCHEIHAALPDYASRGQFPADLKRQFLYLPPIALMRREHAADKGLPRRTAQQLVMCRKNPHGTVRHDLQLG
jgi:hypothetical protein